jgi:hypothetical protein
MKNIRRVKKVMKFFGYSVHKQINKGQNYSPIEIVISERAFAINKTKLHYTAPARTHDYTWAKQASTNSFSIYVF